MFIYNVDEIGICDESPRKDMKVVVPAGCGLENVRVSEGERSKTSTLIQTISLDGEYCC